VAREVFQSAPHARTQSERRRRLALAGGFGSSDRLEQIPGKSPPVQHRAGNWIAASPLIFDDAHIYKNGQELSYGNTTDGTPARSDDSANALFFGSSVATLNFDGSIDEVRLYNRVLTPDEIKRLYRIGATLHTNSGSVGTNDSLKNGLVGYWSFNNPDMAGNVAYDRSGQGNNGTLSTFGTSLPVRAIGKLGQALQFDGVNGYVDLGDTAPLRPTTAITLCGWGRHTPDNGNGGGTIISKDYTAFVLPYSSYQLFMYDRTGGPGTQNASFLLATSTNSVLSVSSPTVLLENTWYHICGTWKSGSSAILYLNGAQNAVSAPSGGSLIYNSGKNALIGAIYEANPAYIFTGQIDEVRVYNRALSADEIKRLYRIGATLHVNTQINNDSLQKGLVGYWSFNNPDMAGIKAYDRSGQGNDGTLCGGPAKTIGKLGQALNFDGVNDYLDMGNGSSLEIQYPLTISAWIYPRSTALLTDTARIVSTDTSTNHSGAGLWWDGSIYASFGDNGGCGSNNRRTKESASGVALGSWSHVVGIIRGQTDMDIYINGINDGGTYDGSGSATIGYGASSATIGGNVNGSCVNGDFNGSIDEVRIYNRALSPDEIKRLYLIGERR
jgi:Concanavalin A-like lectin/glucanases superfamily